MPAVVTGKLLTIFDIKGIAARGDGIADFGNRVVFIPYTASGDRVEATIVGRRNGALVARLERVLSPGLDRIKAPCLHFGFCGSCALQHVQIDAYRDWKISLLRQAMARQKLDISKIRDLIETPMASRRRARFTALRTRRGVQIGFNAAASHKLINIEECHILVPAITAVLDDLRVLLDVVMQMEEKAKVYITETETGLDIWLAANINHNAETDTRLAEFAEAKDLARLSVGSVPHPMLVRRKPRVKIQGVDITPPPESFLQASMIGEQSLAAIVRRGVGEAAKVADLFSGVGTFSFAMGSDKEVVAMEVDKDQVQAMIQGRDSARRTRVKVELRDLARHPLSAKELNAFEAVVFDPPRSGARIQSQIMATSKVPKIVAVSCNPSTFVRDVRSLVDGGYSLQSVTPIDQFTWSRHLELVACLQR